MSRVVSNKGSSIWSSVGSHLGLSGGFEFYEILKGAPQESPNLPNLISVHCAYRITFSKTENLTFR